MKFKLIALSLCMIASANVVKGQETDGNIFSHGDKWKYPAITKPGEMLLPCGLKPLLTFLCLYPKQGMVRRPERTGQASFPL